MLFNLRGQYTFIENEHKSSILETCMSGLISRHTKYLLESRHLVVRACSVMSNSLWPHGLQPTRILCPWDSPGKNAGEGCHFLLQGIFPTQGSNPHLLRLLHWQADSLPLSHLGSPVSIWYTWAILTQRRGKHNQLDSLCIILCKWNKTKHIQTPPKGHWVKFSCEINTYSCP